MLTLDGGIDGMAAFCWAMAAVSSIAMIALMIAFLIWAIGTASDAKRVSEATDKLRVGMTRSEVIETLSPNAPLVPKNYTADSDGSMTFIVERGGFNAVTKRVRVEFDDAGKLIRWITLPY